jgi:hypothetical protein
MRVGDQELTEDLAKVAKVLGKGTVSCKDYETHGRYSHTTQSKRFGSWNGALRAAGLTVSHDTVSDEGLFENILKLWEHYGRQPRRRELALSPSIVSQSPYNLRFGSWTAALQAFIRFANESEVTVAVTNDAIARRLTPRDPSLRLRFKVLQRDNFTCRSCGRCPAVVLGLVLHVDHVIPWSQGGETLVENLQTLCEPCNLGKGNLWPTCGGPAAV